jgi:hypothetical protein
MLRPSTAANCAILFDDSGELGNRLVAFSYLLAFGREHRIPVVNLCFWRYAHFFRQGGQLIERPDETGEGRSPAAFDHLIETFVKAGLSLPASGKIRRSFTLDGALVCGGRAVVARLLGVAARRVVSAIKGAPGAAGLVARRQDCWGHAFSLLLPPRLAEEPFMEQRLLLTHSDSIRPRFEIGPEWREKVDTFLAPLRRRYRRLVGVHLRRGDYASYRGGQWHFDDTDYVRAMRNTLAEGEEETGFILTTNASATTAAFDGLPIHRAPGHLILDMHVLAGCDRLLGPPSTFSGWASFIGRTPIAFLERKAEGVELAPPEVWKPRFY